MSQPSRNSIADDQLGGLLRGRICHKPKQHSQEDQLSKTPRPPRDCPHRFSPQKSGLSAAIRRAIACNRQRLSAMQKLTGEKAQMVF
jgi:hypothetical protein